MSRGLLALLAFAILSAARDVLTSKKLFASGATDAVSITFLYCATTWLFFLGVQLATPRGRSRLAELKRRGVHGRRRSLLLLNAATLVAYLTSFMAIEQTDAFVNALADYGAAPVVTAALALLMRRERFGAREVLGMFISVCGIALLVGAASSGSSANTALGVGLAIVSCVSLGAANIWNKSLVDTGLRRGSLIVGRLVLAVVVLGVWCLAAGKLSTIRWAEDGWKIVCLGLFGMALPLYLVVLAFETLGVRYLALAFFLIPVFTFFGTDLWSDDGWGSEKLVRLGAGAVTLLGVWLAERAASAREAAAAPRPPAEVAAVERVTTM
jgi:drug/metabolite transporter (DMT)-like permease